VLLVLSFFDPGERFGLGGVVLTPVTLKLSGMSGSSLTTGAAKENAFGPEI